jgi:F-type H+-transporting ATPase subunit alpha
MADVRPEEISAILKQQLVRLRGQTNLEEVGTVLQVGDGIARLRPEPRTVRRTGRI